MNDTVVKQVRQLVGGDEVVSGLYGVTGVVDFIEPAKAPGYKVVTFRRVSPGGVRTSSAHGKAEVTVTAR